ncbi:tRNA 2-thiouridine(34) synthase MnmA [Deltaproteobacteria bacterium TL4]
MKNRVAMAMSGGVDSSVAAALLKQQGFEVIGLHMKLYHGPVEDIRSKSCCSLDEALDARTICSRLEIPFYVIDFQEEFQENVIQYFIREYSQGRTPNPCVMCNKNIKSKFLLEKAEELECDYLATGHYARIQRCPSTRRLQLCKPADLSKDQTYFLFGLPSKELDRFLFPLSDYVKSNVRQIAADIGFASANKPDSQEICFVPNDYREFLSQQMPSAPIPGEFINVSGQVIGQHQGLPFYTIGQRRGLGLSRNEPYYVIRLDQQKNQIVVGDESDLYAKTVWVSNPNWLSIDPIQAPVKATVKLRSAHRGAPATLFPTAQGEIRIELETPERAVTPGQAAVFYQEAILLGGGWIENIEFSERTEV